MPENRSNNKRRTNSRPSGHHGPKKKKRVPNYPRIFGWSIGLLLVIAIIVIVLRISIWDKGIAYIMTPEDYEKIKLDTLDNVILMPPSVLNPDSDDGVTRVLVFGNDSYRAGKDKEKSILDQFSKELDGKNVELIDCCLPGSYMISYNETEESPAECPEDYFTLFWLVLNTNSKDFSKQEEALQYLDSSKYDMDRYREVVSILRNVDFKNIDVVLFCYDGHDYVKGNKPINYLGEDAQTENVATHLGAIYVTIYVINSVNPDTQFVYVSPAFCYATDENGKKVSCAMYDTGYGTIEEMFNSARLVTNYYGMSYVDMYSGVLINENNGKHYLEDDGITPNEKGRKMIADRLVTLLKDRL